MKLRNGLVAAAIFTCLGAAVGLAKAPQFTSEVPASNEAGRKNSGPQRVMDEGKRMTAAQRRAHRKDFSIHFVRKNSGTVVVSRESADR